MITGVDVSHWNETVDWQRAAGSGLSFAILKASEGAGYRDGRYAANRSNARAAGLLTGSYHYFRPGQDADSQAEAFFACLDGQDDLPPALDLEEHGGLSRPVLEARVRRFLERMQVLGAGRCLIYTSPGFWTTFLPANPDWAAAYPLWEAHYTGGFPLPLYPWAQAVIWQYSARGRLPGFPGAVDLNRAWGSRSDLIALKGAVNGCA